VIVFDLLGPTSRCGAAARCPSAPVSGARYQLRRVRAHASAVSLLLYQPGEADPFLTLPLDPRYNRTVTCARLRARPALGRRVRLADGRRAQQEPAAAPLRSIGAAARPLRARHRGAAVWAGGVAGARSSPTTTSSGRTTSRSTRHWPTRSSTSCTCGLHAPPVERRRGARHVPRPGERIPYLKELGVTAVELLPVSEFDETDNVTRTRSRRTAPELLGLQHDLVLLAKASYARRGPSSASSRRW